MAGNDPISRLAQQLGERLQNASHAPEEIQRSVQGAMRSAFERMELVTREDFDILMDVLQRTRSRVEALERQVAALESALDEKSPAVSPAMVAADTAAPPAEDAGNDKHKSGKKTPDMADNKPDGTKKKSP
nr:accessory factor UbiK family protein [uncultured Halomonas sp.]